MATATDVNREWAKRPDDERFLSLCDLYDFCEASRQQSRALVVSSRSLTCAVDSSDVMGGLVVQGQNGVAYEPTNWAFGQLATLSGAPAAYLRKLPAPLVADNLNWSLSHERDVEDVGLLLRKNGKSIFAAATGPNYGRIWNADIANALLQRFGDGITGAWKVPGEFGRSVPVTKANTTIYASDRDMFVFLADEERRIEIPNRRDGKSGSLARGFYVKNSEVGAAKLTLAMYLFDYACCNRILWGVEQSLEVSIRHSKGAPDRFLEEVQPVLEQLQHAAPGPIVQAIEDARAHKVDDMMKFLGERFGAKLAASSINAFTLDEGRKPDTRWDAATAVTAYARGLPHQDVRVTLEREAGKLLTL